MDGWFTAAPCPPSPGRRSTIWHVSVMKHYSVIRENFKTCMGLKNITQNEKRPSQKATQCVTLWTSTIHKCRGAKSGPASAQGWQGDRDGRKGTACVEWARFWLPLTEYDESYSIFCMVVKCNSIMPLLKKICSVTRGIENRQTYSMKFLVHSKSFGSAALTWL